MTKLILMMGIPGAGKSTIAKKKFDERDIYISRDEIRFSMVSENEEYFSKENEVFQSFVDQINMALTKDYRYVVADATHLNSGSRMKLLSRIKTRPKTCLLFINTPIEIAIERNNQRSGRSVVPEKIIRNMYNSISMPSKNEPIDIVYIANENGEIYRKKEMN